MLITVEQMRQIVRLQDERRFKAMSIAREKCTWSPFTQTCDRIKATNEKYRSIK